MPFANAALSMSAFVASSASNMPGMIFIDSALAPKSNFSIASCTAETVVVAGVGADTALQPGHILAYIGNEHDTDHYVNEDESSCVRCSPLFRKIVAHSVSSSTNTGSSSNNKNGDVYTTFTTTLATFSEVFQEVFPDDMLIIESLENEYIEPKLGCDHSSFEKKKERKLPYHESGIVARYNSFREEGHCELIPLYLILIGMCACAVPFCAPCITFVAGLLQIYDFFHCGDDYRRRNLVHNEEKAGGKEMTEPPFPRTCEEWMNADSDGNCLYAECNVAAVNNEGARSCFSRDSNNTLLGKTFHATNVSTSFVKSNDFNEAWCMQNSCYASKFSKVTCDKNVYKQMRAKCDSLGTEPATFVEASFPLTASVVNQNCYMTSFVLYLGMKLFGHASYNDLHLKQKEYEETRCVANSLTEVSGLK